MTYNPDDDRIDTDRTKPGLPRDVQLADVFTKGIYTLSLHPVAVLLCIVALCLLDQATTELHTMLAGRPGPDLTIETMFRSFWILAAILAVRTPLDAVLDAIVLGSVYAACWGHRPCVRSAFRYVRLFWSRMFIINVVVLIVFVITGWICIPLFMLAVLYLRFIAVYVVAQNVDVGNAVSRFAPVLSNPASRFLPLYLLATSFFLIIAHFVNLPVLPGVSGRVVSVLGDLILGYADLAVVCTAFYLLRHVQTKEVKA